MDDVDRLARIFQMQGTLQNEFGYDFNEMDGDRLVDYIKMNILALTDELHEALSETYWKPWSKKEPGFKDRDRYTAELSDVLHFFVNLCLAARMTPDELMAKYEDKNAVNHTRHETGYDGTNKCDACGGALDEPTIVKIFATAGGERYCSGTCLAAGPR